MKASTRSRQAKTEDVAATYNAFKEFEGRVYTGMKIGRSHKWNYDPGVWKETKITPDRWEIEFAVTKRRAGHAPEGSGVPVGTSYHWYILAHQNVTKLNANDYSTSMTGLKVKLAHRRAEGEKWSASPQAQRRALIKVLQEMVRDLEKQNAADARVAASTAREKPPKLPAAASRPRRGPARGSRVRPAPRARRAHRAAAAAR